MKSKIVLFGLLLITLCEIVQCQMGGMMRMMNTIPTMINGMRESQARSQLSPIVKYIVGETATPSPEMVNFAVIAGSSPVTQTEKDAYLEMMKKVARRTPEVVVKFIKIKNGTYSLDTTKLDAHVTKRAMQYAAASRSKKERKATAETRKRNEELDMLRMMQRHELELIGALGQVGNTQPDPSFVGMDPGVGYDVFGPGFSPAADFGTFHHQELMAPNNQVPANSQTQAGSTSNVAPTRSFSLLDILSNQSQNHQGNGTRSAATPDMTSEIPAPTAHMQAGDQGMMNFMLLNGGMDMGFGF